MSSCELHIEQAEHNFNLVKDLISQNPIVFKDWAVTVAFYSALHFVEALLCKKLNIHTENIRDRSPHNYRKELVDNYISEISDEYRELYNLSRSLRYLCRICGSQVGVGGNWLSEDDIKEIAKDYIDLIEKTINKKISS